MAMNGQIGGETSGVERVVIMRERRITSAEHCSTCDSRRKTWAPDLGWVCTVCFERCKARAEQVVEVGSGVSRLRQAYENAIHSYKEQVSV